MNTKRAPSKKPQAKRKKPASPRLSPAARAAAHLEGIQRLVPRVMLRDQAYAERSLRRWFDIRSRSGSRPPDGHSLPLSPLPSPPRPHSPSLTPHSPPPPADRRPGPPVTARLIRDLAALEARLESSARELNRRKRRVPRVSYPNELPITARKDEIVGAIRSNRVVIISGETGCGKSTQIPKMCLEAGRGIAGRIGCTQPRRIAAITIAHRIAEELGTAIGGAASTASPVGYKIRFQDRTTRDGYIKIMTDGILLAETQGDRLLTEYDTIIIDEAHERSLNIDFLLGIARKLLDARPELKLIITSATLDTAKFSEAFRKAPVIEVTGRLYPVKLEYRPPDREEAEDKDYVDQAVDAVAAIRRDKSEGDILVFMPTEQDILETCRILEGRRYHNTSILPLFSRLPAGQQRMVYTVEGPKIVVATNVAETSLTIPGIRYVVDTGVARISQYQPGTRINSLPISPISRASADQRKGRCGRVREGLCVRLYDETDYEAREEFTAPEILRSDLAEVILRMIDLRLGDPREFPFIDRPASKAIRDGYDTLIELGAIYRIYKDMEIDDDREGHGRSARVQEGKGGELKSPGKDSLNTESLQGRRIRGGRRGGGWDLTEKGRLMARMPLDPRISRMLIEAGAENCLHEVAVLAAALSIRDPRERPPAKAPQADAVHAAFRHPDSDFLVLLNIWNRYHGDFEKLTSLTQKRRFCHEHFLSFPRMREWVYLHKEILDVLREMRMLRKVGRGGEKGLKGTEPPLMPVLGRASDMPHQDVSPVLYAGIHRSILSGYLSNIAAHKEKNVYAAAKNREVTIWPGSVLFNKSAAWLVATEMIRTSRLFARTSARIDPSWLEALGGPLCKRSYSDARWDRARGEVVAKEKVTLFGLEIVRDRRVSYGPINPAEAHEIFVMSGLVEGAVDDPPDFLRHNLALQKKLESMEDKLRRRDIMVPEAKIAKFYSAHLAGTADVASLRKLIKDMGGDEVLRLKEDDLYSAKPSSEVVDSFPDIVEIVGRPFEAVYKFAPGEDDDGVSLKVPAELLSAVPAERLEWGVAGQYEDKITALIKGLPKRYRKLLVPVVDKAKTIAEEMPRTPEEVPLFKAVAGFVLRKFGVDIPVRVWAEAEIPRHMRMRVAVVDKAGSVLVAGRDVELLRRKLGAADAMPSKVESPAWEEARKTWEKTCLTSWDFGDLPEKVQVGMSLSGYLGLVERERCEGVESGESGEEGMAGGVDVRLFPMKEEALQAHRRGVRWLLMKKFAKELAFVRRYHKIPADYEEAARYFGGRGAVEEAIERGLAREAFEKNIRTEEEFKAYETEVGRALFEKGHVLTQMTLRVLGLHGKIRKALGGGSGGELRGGGRISDKEGKGRRLGLYELSRLKEKGKVVPTYVEEIERDLAELVPKNFPEVYSVDRLARIPRYLDAMISRLERGRIDPEKDKAKAAQVEPFREALERLERELERESGRVGGGDASAVLPAVVSEKRAAVDEFRWMIEEFKIALFAPEIKTAFPISAVRLAKKVKEIEGVGPR